MNMNDSNDFECYDEPVEVERNPCGAGVVVSARFSPAEATALFERASATNRQLTAVVREATLAFLRVDAAIPVEDVTEDLEDAKTPRIGSPDPH